VGGSCESRAKKAALKPEAISRPARARRQQPVSHGAGGGDGVADRVGDDRLQDYHWLRLVYAGGIDILQQTLGSDPKWSEGLDFSKFDMLPRSKHGTTQPTLAAARAAKTGEYDLTNEQWGSIEHLFIDKLSKPASGRPAAIDMRTAMNGILIKIRTGCAWEKKPVNFGTGAELLNIVQRLHYHGVWHAARGILTEKFPKVVDVLPVEHLFAGWQLRRPNTSNAGQQDADQEFRRIGARRHKIAPKKIAPPREAPAVESETVSLSRR
jgi:transposase